MIKQQRYSIRTATTDDKNQLTNLIHFEVHVHRHLGWRSPLDWIGSNPFLVAEVDEEIQAVIACPPDPPIVAWIKLYAVAANVPIKRSWDNLWVEAREQLVSIQDLIWVAAIPTWPWFAKLLQGSGFTETHSVVMLAWDGGSFPATNHAGDLSVRPMNLEDVTTVHRIDAGSFVPLWQNSQRELELAFRQSSIATVAELNGAAVGYQISTTTTMGGHLARLAVDPEHQGCGIGYALVHDCLKKFEQRRADRVTVNTQKENLASLKLYEKAGFYNTGDEYPIYQLDVSQES